MIFNNKNGGTELRGEVVVSIEQVSYTELLPNSIKDNYKYLDRGIRYLNGET